MDATAAICIFMPIRRHDEKEATTLAKRHVEDICWTFSKVFAEDKTEKK